MNRRPRLLVLASTYPRWANDPEPGFVHELSKRLVDRFDVTVLAPHARGAARRETLDGVDVVRYRYAPDRLETLVNDGGIVANLKRSRWKLLLLPVFLWAQAWSTWRLIRRNRPDIVHAHWLVPQGLIVAILRVLDPITPPFVVTSHGADLFALRAQPLQALKRFTAKRAGALTVVSAAMAEELVRMGVARADVHIEPMGVDLRDRFRPDADVARSGDELLFVGRLVEKKGLRHLIDAMPAILREHPSARLTIAGFGPDEASRRHQVSSLGLDEQVKFVGAVSQAELPDMYRRAAVFVAPFVRASNGDQEGLGLVLVEAAGCGCPVVAGDVPAVRDVVKSAAIGAVVSAHDPGALAEAVCLALRTPVTEDAACARADAVQYFDWRRRADAYSAVLTARLAD